MTRLTLTLTVETPSTDAETLHELLAALHDNIAHAVAEDYAIEDTTDPQDPMFLGHRSDGYEGPFITAIKQGTRDYDLPARAFV